MEIRESDVSEIIKRYKPPVIIHDSRFDLDAFCSAVLMKELVQELIGYDAPILYQGIIPDRGLRIIGDDEGRVVNQSVDLKNYDFSNNDLLISTDSSRLQHLVIEDDFEPPTDIDIMNIDHHYGNRVECEYRLHRSVGATCTIIYEIYKACGILLDDRRKRLLSTGIITDTGLLQFDTISSKDLRAIAEILDSGFPIHTIFHKLNFNQSVERSKFISYVYDNMIVDEDLKVTYFVTDDTEIRKAGISLDLDTEGVSDLIKIITGNLITFTLWPTEGDGYRVSFRSHDLDIPVLELAKRFGGGGHKNAAGGIISGVDSLDEALDKVLSEVELYLKEGGWL